MILAFTEGKVNQWVEDLVFLPFDINQKLKEFYHIHILITFVKNTALLRITFKQFVIAFKFTSTNS